MKKWSIFLSAVLVLSAASAQACLVNPSLLNPSFEQGFAGWTASGEGTQQVLGYGNGISAPETNAGRYFLFLTAGPLEDSYVSSTDTFTLGSTTTLSGWIRLWPSEGGSEGSLAILRVRLTGVGSVIYYTEVPSDNWYNWSKDVPRGTYYLEYTLSNGAATGTAKAAFDAAVPTTTSSVPIPPTALLLASGLIGLIGVRRRGKN